MMNDYKKIAHEKYMQRKKIIIEEDEKQKKILEEEQKRIEEEQKRIRVYIQTQITIIEDSILTFNSDKDDDNILLIITNIIASIENIIDIIGETEKQIIISQIINFTNEVDKMNISRPKSINTIKIVNLLSKGFRKIYDLLGLDAEIITLDTDDDELIARNLARPPHLAGAAQAAIDRAKYVSSLKK